MAVNIDNVYQRVLVIANKEQRGYITPQEFNLLAYKAQMDIFESYFYNYGGRLLSPNVDTQIITDAEILQDKILPFRTVQIIDNPIANLPVGSIGGLTYGHSSAIVSSYEIPKDIHYLETITNSTMSIAEEVTMPEFWKMLSLTKFRPFSILKPIFARGPISGSSTIHNAAGVDDGNIRAKHVKTGTISKGNLVITPGVGTLEGKSGLKLLENITCTFIRKPKKPAWAYVVVDEKPLYNPNMAVDFELHASEESTLTNKILELAGVVINKPDLSELILRNEGMKDAIKNQ